VVEVGGGGGRVDSEVLTWRRWRWWTCRNYAQV